MLKKAFFRQDFLTVRLYDPIPKCVPRNPVIIQDKTCKNVSVVKFTTILPSLNLHQCPKLTRVLTGDLSYLQFLGELLGDVLQ